MKKILAIALVAVFVLGMAVSAFAANLEVTGDGTGVKINGAYRLRAISTNNFSDGDDDLGDHDSYYHQRLRLGLDFIVGEDVTVSTRGDIAEGVWDGKADTQGNNGYFDVDHAFVVIKKFDMAFTIGLQEASWGNKFWSWANQAERIKVTKKIGEITVGAFTQKDNEDHLDAVPDYAGDTDSNAIFVVVPVADGKLSAIYVKTDNKEVDLDGTTMDIAFSGKFGAISAAAEYVAKGGDLGENAGGEKPMGFFVAANMDVTDAINVGAAYASVQNGFVTDDDFGPTLLFGTSANATAVMQFGFDAQFSESGAYDDTASAIVLSAKMKSGDDMNFGANVAQANLSKESEIDVTEIDLWMDYNLATNTKFWAGYAYAMVDVPGVDIDPMTSAAFQIETKF